MPHIDLHRLQRFIRVITVREKERKERERRASLSPTRQKHSTTHTTHARGAQVIARKHPEASSNSCNMPTLRVEASGEAWVLETDKATVRALPPVVHGSSRSGSKWEVPLVLGSSNTDEAPNGVMRLHGSTDASHVRPGLSLAWELHLATHESGGATIQLTVSVQKSDLPGQDEPLAIEGITLCTINLKHLGEASADARDVDAKVERAISSRLFAGLAAGALIASATFLSLPATLASGSAVGFAWWRRRKGHIADRSSSFLINGWQSFSFSGAIATSDQQPKTSLPYFSGAFHTGAVAPSAKARLTSDLFGVLLRDGNEHGGVLLGFVTVDHAVGGVSSLGHGATETVSVFAEHRASLTVGGAALTTDRALVLPIGPSESAGCSGSDALRACAAFTDALAAGASVPITRCGRGSLGSPGRPTPFGWCSWYCHGPNVSEPLMLETIGRLAKARTSHMLPIELVQLDDGWQSQWGDWLMPHPTRFPAGLRPISDCAKQNGMLAGLWIAPAALTSNSRLFSEKPEWILRSKSGKPLKCGWTAPGLWLYALDVTHPGALAYIREVVRTAVRDWGFSYLKLDFLHTAAMPGAVRYDASIGRGQALRRMLTAVRETVGPDVFVLACGAPLAPCVGLVDAMRVSADAATHWLPTGIDLPGTRWLFAHDRTNLPAARNMVRNVGVRMPFGGRLWRNDPDCLILREEASFTIDEARALATVAALSAGALIFSDPPESLAPARLAILRALLPPLPRAAVPIDLLDREIPAKMVTPLCGADAVGGSGGIVELGSWLLLGLFNWYDGTHAAGGDATVPIDVLLKYADAAAQGRSQVAASWRNNDAGATEENGTVQHWHSFEFWEERYERIAGAVYQPPAINARCGRLVCLRPIRSDRLPQLVGTNIHVSCGLEFKVWQPSDTTLRFQLHAACAIATPCIWIYWNGSAKRNLTMYREGHTKPQVSPCCISENDEVWKLTLHLISARGDTDVYTVNLNSD